MAWHLAGTIIISFLVLVKDLPFPYIDPDYNSPLIYWWGYCICIVFVGMKEAESFSFFS